MPELTEDRIREIVNEEIDRRLGNTPERKEQAQKDLEKRQPVHAGPR